MADTPSLADAIQSLYPTARWTMVGGVYSGLTWLDTTQAKPTEAELTAQIAILAAAAAVPTVLSAMQAKVQLSRAGLLPQVQAWIDGQNAETQLIWNTATSFDRNSALINSAAASLGLTPAQLDALFVAAAAINP